ncbi:hypothetical protein D3C76_1338350 [compost metagenome]
MNCSARTVASRARIGAMSSRLMGLEEYERISPPSGSSSGRDVSSQTTGASSVASSSLPSSVNSVVSPQCRSSKQITKGCCTATRSNTSSKAWNSPWVRAWLLIAPYRMGGSADDTPVSTCRNMRCSAATFRRDKAASNSDALMGGAPPRLSRLATNCPRGHRLLSMPKSSTSPRKELRP